MLPLLRHSILISAMTFAAPLFAGNAPIVLETDSTVLRLDVKGDKVNATYFGQKVATLGDTDDAPGAELFYPSRWDAFTGPHGLAITQSDGTLACDPVYVSHEVTSPAAGDSLLKIRLKDRRYLVEYTFGILAHKTTNVFERWVEITNKGDKPVVVGTRPSFGHAPPGRASRYFVTSFMGSWAAETGNREREVARGEMVSLRSTSTPKGAAMGSPSFVLSLDKPADEDTGEVILGSLAWSGNWKLDFVNDYESGELDVAAGYDEAYSAYTLDAGKTLATPRLILTHSQHGAGEATRNLHRWARSGAGVRGGDRIRDILLNSWEGAYFKFDEKLLHGMMDGCQKMGVELFVVDDGWFGDKHPRNDDTAGLGDWQVNTVKLPHGLEGLAKAAHERGVKFGIWVEPEMVNPKSELYEKHPDWVVAIKDHPRREGRNQLVLDLTRPEVRDFIVGTMDDLLSGNPDIVYVKWDCNYTIVDPGSGYLDGAHQKNLQVDYIKGYYETLDRITRKHPSVVFQACGSGGGRVDYGALKYHHEFWTSDNTDPYDRVFILWGTGYFFPAIAMAAHVTESPNHYSKRVTPLKFRFDVAMSGRLGLELQPQRLTSQELAWADKAVGEYKRIRPVVQFGDLYRLQSPYKGDIAALQYVLDDKGVGRSIFFAYLKEHRLISAYGPIALRGLDPSKRYRVTEFNLDAGKPIVAGSGKVFGGDYLMTRGLGIAWNWKALQSVAVEITEEPAAK